MWSEDPDGTQQVAPSALIPMLTKALQELSAKNDALEARIKKLEDG
jgi:cell division protein FtsB